MKVKIIIEADMTGISKAVLDECEDELAEQFDSNLEGGSSYYVTHPDTEKEYEVNLSVTKVSIEH